MSFSSLDFLTLTNKALLSGMLTGVIVSVSSTSWLGVWLGLELNLLCFVPLLVNYKEGGGDMSLKYFLVQACGSLILLMGGISASWSEEIWVLISLALFLKMGSAPFHWWYLILLEEMEWGQFLILSVLQKIAPLILLFYSVSVSSKFIYWVILILCSVIGGIGGLAGMSLRKLLGYSSINHMSWMVLPISLSSSSWVVYFIMYALITMSVVSSAWNFQLYHLSQSSSKKIPKMMMISLIVALFSIMGAPPFTGFFPKWVVIKDSLTSTLWSLLIVMIFFNIVTLFYYLRWSVAILFCSLYFKEVDKNILNLKNWGLLFNSLGLIISGGVCLSFLH